MSDSKRRNQQSGVAGQQCQRSSHSNEFWRENPTCEPLKLGKPSQEPMFPFCACFMLFGRYTSCFSRHHNKTPVKYGNQEKIYFLAYYLRVQSIKEVSQGIRGSFSHCVCSQEAERSAGAQVSYYLTQDYQGWIICPHLMQTSPLN